MSLTLRDPFFSSAISPLGTPSLWGGIGVDPFREIDELMNRMVGPVFAPVSGELQTVLPRADIQETDKEFVLSLEMPGVKKENTKVEFDNKTNTLFISGDTKKEEESAEGNWLRRERRYGSFNRSFVLPQICNFDAINAKMDHGVLKVYVPKREQQAISGAERKAISLS